MEQRKISFIEVNKASDKFLEFLKMQPNYLRVPEGMSEGEHLANQIFKFALKLKELKAQHCGS